MDELLGFIVEESLIVIPALWVIGMIVKNTPSVKDWLIPYILLLVGIASTVAISGVNIDSFIQGVLVSGAAVFGHELVKQYKEKERD